MITWWMKLGGNLPPGHDTLLFSMSDTGSFIWPVTQTAGYTKAFDYPVMDQWGKVKVLRHEADSNRRPVGPQSNTPTTRPQYTPGPQRGGNVFDIQPASILIKSYSHYIYETNTYFNIVVFNIV